MTRPFRMKAMNDGTLPKRRPEIVYVVLVDDRPVVAFKAVSQAEARELVRERWFRSDLRRRANEGVPLWSDQAKIRVRAATPIEVFAAAVVLNGAEASDRIALAYLVKIDKTAAQK
jgi:hypothetical protein